jgi:hypothetical protein
MPSRRMYGENQISELDEVRIDRAHPETELGTKEVGNFLEKLYEVIHAVSINPGSYPMLFVFLAA